MDSFASWKMNGRGIEKEERGRRRHFKEKMSLEEAHHHRWPWIRAWRKKEMNEGRGREEHIFYALKELRNLKFNFQMIKVEKMHTHGLYL
ncbi:hypothetical protein GmHk_13G036347 [Glycine max]|nr:hypothetical protein GmHk_13G036347 [Glycine max]